MRYPRIGNKQHGMNQKLKTSFEFAKNLFVTGAFMETSANVEHEICRHIPRDRDVVVVEYGIGHGNITREILRTISAGSRLFAFEVNPEFCDHVARNIPDERLNIINDGAERVKDYITGKVDGVIASIPFTFFSKEKSMTIIQNSYDLLHDGTYYSQVLYTKFNFRKFEAVFDHCEMVRIPNFPTEFVYHCGKKGEATP